LREQLQVAVAVRNEQETKSRTRVNEVEQHLREIQEFHQQLQQVSATAAAERQQLQVELDEAGATVQELTRRLDQVQQESKNERQALREQVHQLRLRNEELLENREDALKRAKSVETHAQEGLQRLQADHITIREKWEHEHEAQRMALEEMSRERLAFLAENGQLRDQAQAAVRDRDAALARLEELCNGAQRRRAPVA
jgi:hypothetical protein